MTAPKHTSDTTHAAEIDRPHDLLDEATASVLAGIGEARHALAAELVLCDAFWAAELGAPDDAGEEERLDVLTTMLSGVITYAESLASEDALALLRVASVLGPDASRAAAQVSAGNLTARGIPDRPWADRIGHPQLLRAWHYGDNFGQQESVGLAFDYRGREHTMLVLIDHPLGGGLKDCYIAEGRRAKSLHDDTIRRLPGDGDTYFEDIDAERAVEVLDLALSHPTCPEQVDQIEDIGRHLYLLRARMDRLRQLATASA